MANKKKIFPRKICLIFRKSSKQWYMRKSVKVQASSICNYERHFHHQESHFLLKAQGLYLPKEVIAFFRYPYSQSTASASHNFQVFLASLNGYKYIWARTVSLPPIYHGFACTTLTHSYLCMIVRTFFLAAKMRTAKKKKPKTLSVHRKKHV